MQKQQVTLHDGYLASNFKFQVLKNPHFPMISQLLLEDNTDDVPWFRNVFPNLLWYVLIYVYGIFL